MSAHQAFPEFAMVGHEKVQQFVHNDVVPDALIHPWQFCVEIQMPRRGARRPFVAHGANAKPDDLHIQFNGPITDALFEVFLLIDGFHGFRFGPLFQAR